MIVNFYVIQVYMNMAEEIWKKIKNHDNFMVSNHGRVRDAFTNELIVPYTIHESIGGYPTISLGITNGVKTYLVNKIVAEAFLPKPDDAYPDHFVINRNNDVNNNHVSNLKWANGDEYAHIKYERMG